MAAYDQLVAEGYLVTRPGGATRVHPDAVDTRARAASAAHAEDPSGPWATPRGQAAGIGGSPAPSSGHPRVAGDGRPAIDLRPGFSREEVAADSMWREAWRSAAGSVGEDDDGRGLEATRKAIAEHLRLTRAMNVDPGDIVVTGGAREGLFSLLSSLQELGFRSSVAIENPGYPGLRGAIRRSGIEVLSMAEEIPAAAGAAVVTPNRLYPLGGSMPAPRRMELLRTAERYGTLIIEDDLDSQYRHIGPLMPTLWELAPGAVAHLGTFNQVLSAQARLGYLIIARQFQEPLLGFRRDLGLTPSAIAQRALATYLDHGGLRRYLARRRREVARRRELALELLGAVDLRMHAEATAIVRLPREEVWAVVAECRSGGVLIESLASYWSGGEEAGIVFTYGRGTVEELRRAMMLISMAIRRCATPIEARSAL